MPPIIFQRRARVHPHLIAGCDSRSGADNAGKARSPELRRRQPGSCLVSLPFRCPILRPHSGYHSEPPRHFSRGSFCRFSQPRCPANEPNSRRDPVAVIQGISRRRQRKEQLVCLPTSLRLLPAVPESNNETQILFSAAHKQRGNNETKGLSIVCIVLSPVKMAVELCFGS